MTKRSDGIIAEALTKSAVFLDAIPANRLVHREQARRVTIVCEALLRARPAVEPLTPAVTEQGKIRHSDFPAGQSLLNRHGPLMRIWREAYHHLVTASAPPRSSSADPWALGSDELSALDHGTRARITLMAAVLRETQLQLQRTKRIIEDQLPAPGQGPGTQVADTVTPATRQSVCAWLDGLESTGMLTAGADGLRTSTRARPGTVVMPMHVLQALLSIAGNISNVRRYTRPSTVPMRYASNSDCQ